MWEPWPFRDVRIQKEHQNVLCSVLPGQQREKDFLIFGIWAPLCDPSPEVLGVPHTKKPSILCLASSTAGDLQLVAGLWKRYGHLASRPRGVQQGRKKETCVLQGLNIISINIVDDLNLDPKSCSPSPVIYLLLAFTSAFCWGHPSFESTSLY